MGPATLQSLPDRAPGAQGLLALQESLAVNWAPHCWFPGNLINVVIGVNLEQYIKCNLSNACTANLESKLKNVLLQRPKAAREGPRTSALPTTMASLQ